jgi:hypothetical protein
VGIVLKPCREALEVGVAQMGEENAKLRARLAELLAARSSVAPPEIASATPPPASAKPIESGVDYAYLSKIQSEIHTAKATLLERELELNRLRNDTPVKADASIDNLRRGLLKQYTKQTYLQAEATSLETMIGQIRTEKDELGKQTDLLNRDILHRKTYQIVEVPTEPPQSEAMEVDVGVGEMEEHGEIAHDHEHEEAIGDKSMMDIGGWVDAAWQVSRQFARATLAEYEPSVHVGRYANDIRHLDTPYQWGSRRNDDIQWRDAEYRTFFTTDHETQRTSDTMHVVNTVVTTAPDLTGIEDRRLAIWETKGRRVNLITTENGVIRRTVEAEILLERLVGCGILEADWPDHRTADRRDSLPEVAVFFLWVFRVGGAGGR